MALDTTTQWVLPPLFEGSGYLPGESSQTTLEWPIRRTMAEPGEIIVCSAENCAVTGYEIHPVGRDVRQQLMDEVFEAHAEAWSRLAEL